MFVDVEGFSLRTKNLGDGLLCYFGYNIAANNLSEQQSPQSASTSCPLCFCPAFDLESWRKQRFDKRICRRTLFLRAEGGARECLMNALRSDLLMGLKILVVDDAPDNRLLVSRFLSLAGASVEVSDNAVDGIAAALQGHFDLVLMDIQMPSMDGYEAIQRLRRLNYKVPVVALTAHAMTSDRSRCLASGFNAYLPKPIAHAQLVATVYECVRAGRASQADTIPTVGTQPDQVSQPETQEVNQNQVHTTDSRIDLQ
ncbi:MAG: response regulator [Betaproteobacteria bacterium]|nr:response regulator [Betaproteobacteria bacterium]